jgi:siroheme synthase (precorrin-2 oxidase/ferrochelatase)
LEENGALKSDASCCYKLLKQRSVAAAALTGKVRAFASKPVCPKTQRRRRRWQQLSSHRAVNTLADVLTQSEKQKNKNPKKTKI